MARRLSSDERLQQAYRDLEEMDKKRKRNRNDLWMFFVGLLLFGGGVFMILQNIVVKSTVGGGGYFYHIGSWGVPNGLIMLPVLIGVIMLFAMDKKIFGWIVFVLGILFILLTILMTVRISWRTSSAYAFLIMFGMAAAGGGMLMRVLFRKD